MLDKEMAILIAGTAAYMGFLLGAGFVLLLEQIQHRRRQKRGESLCGRPWKGAGERLRWTNGRGDVRTLLKAGRHLVERKTTGDVDGS